jgi:hypothetical protein
MTSLKDMLIWLLVYAVVFLLWLLVWLLVLLEMLELEPMLNRKESLLE